MALGATASCRPFDAGCLGQTKEKHASRSNGFVTERLSRAPVGRPSVARHGSYLVDPASSHMLVSKIKPCMSKHKPLHGEAANGSLGHP